MLSPWRRYCGLSDENMVELEALNVFVFFKEKLHKHVILNRSTVSNVHLILGKNKSLRLKMKYPHDAFPRQVMLSPAMKIRGHNRCCQHPSTGVSCWYQMFLL